jgi:hypothetical protein
MGRQISTIPGEELQRVNNSAALVLSAIDQEGKIFSTCFSPVFFVTPCKDYHHSESAYLFLHRLLTFPTLAFDVTLAECRAGAYFSNRKIHPILLVCTIFCNSRNVDNVRRRKMFRFTYSVGYTCIYRSSTSMYT